MIIRYKVVLGFIKKEFIQIMRDPKMIGALFFIPVVQMVMFGLALTSEVKNIKFVIAAKPSKLSRQIETKALASGWFKEVNNINGAQIADPMQLLIDQKAEAVLVAPKEGLEYALEKGGKPLQLLINATNAQRAQQVDGYVKQIVLQTAKENGYSSGAGLIDMQIRVMYNHYMETSFYMIPALIAMAVFLVIMLVCGMSIAKEKEVGTMEKLIASPASVEEILLGKTLPYFLVGIFIVLFMYSISSIFFGLPLRGYFWQLLINGALIILISLSAATLLSTIVKTQQQAMMGTILVVLPVILLSGVFFPVENIPLTFRWGAYINPLMYCMVTFRNIMLKGGDMTFFIQNVAAVTAFSLLLLGVAYKNFKSTLN